MASQNGHRTADLPIIDLNSATASQELLDAACRWGFVFVKHHDIELDPRNVDRIFELSRSFFQSSPSEKVDYAINAKTSGKNHGWLGMHTETLDPAHQKKGDFKEAFNIAEFRDGRPQQDFPPLFKQNEAEFEKFLNDCHAVCNHILKLFAIALDISPEHGGKDWFSMRHDQSKGASGSILRLLYYPPLPDSVQRNPEEDIRAGAHSDYGSITLLFRLPSQPGLEIQTPDDSWASVPLDPDPKLSGGTLPILVNIGDLLSYWTNGLLKSTVHRVIFPNEGEGPERGEERYSIAYFCHPEDEAELVEVPSQVLKQRLQAIGVTSNGTTPTLTARGHLNSRLAATYNIGK